MFLEIISATIDFKLFSFQIRVSFAVVVPVVLYIILHLALLHSHTCLKVTYRVLMEIMNATIDFYFFQIGVSNAVVVPVHHSSFGPST